MNTLNYVLLAATILLIAVWFIDIIEGINKRKFDKELEELLSKTRKQLND